MAMEVVDNQDSGHSAGVGHFPEQRSVEDRLDGVDPTFLVLKQQLPRAYDIIDWDLRETLNDQKLTPTRSY